jgi:hypothetical protein
MVGCPISLCDYRKDSCSDIFYVDKCFYNSNNYKYVKPKPIVKKWF